ncbi:MAG TPA: hypothetical protein VGJ22_13785 [Anaerolineales bacterium]
MKENRTIKDGEKLVNALTQMIEENLDTRKWDLHLGFTASSRRGNATAIYESPRCRVSFSYSQQQRPEHDELSVEFGRLHAANEMPFMKYQGEECRCWHNFVDPLRFLDDLSAEHAKEQFVMPKGVPSVIEAFSHSEAAKKTLNEFPPLYAVTLQSVIWKHYGQRLFDLFDLRRPELWEKYRRFIKEYYRLLGMKASFGPPYENIC